MTRTFPQRLPAIRIALAAFLVVCFAAFAFRTRQWEWLSDEQVFRYIQFLMSRGLAPYRQITDINLPGSYLVEWLATSLFGSSDLGFRFYDWSLLVLLTVAATSIARPYDWFAGLYAGTIFAVMHGADGAINVGERDMVMTVLLLGAYAFAFTAVRRLRPSLFFPAALLVGIGCTLKPTALLFGLLLIVLAGVHLRRQRVALAPYLLQVAAAVLVVALALAAFFLWRNSFPSFLQSMALAKSYSTVNEIPLRYMLRHSMPAGLGLLLPAALCLSFTNRSWRDWEMLAVAGGALLGLASYFVQDKGFTYHRYPFVGFALLWCGLEFVIAMRSPGWPRTIAAAALLIGTLVLGPFYLARMGTVRQTNVLTHRLMDDLQRYPAGSLDGHIECIDGLNGCYSALYRLHIRQSTGLMGDHLLFTGSQKPAIVALQQQTLHELEAAPPTVIVFSNFWYGQPSSFRNLDNFPALAAFLNQHYKVVAQYPDTLPIGVNGYEPDAYRLYQLNR